MSGFAIVHSVVRGQDELQLLALAIHADRLHACSHPDLEIVLLCSPLCTDITELAGMSVYRNRELPIDEKIFTLLSTDTAPQSTSIMANYGKIPANASLKPKPFTANVDEQKLQRMKDLIRLCPVGPATFENTSNGRRYGMQREWLTSAVKNWEKTFDWRQVEAKINSYPNYTVPVRDSDGTEINVHFIALFSEKKDAIPIAFFHGWPGSFMEFFDILDILKNRHSPQDLPYHVIVPSLPGYGYSSAPPLDMEYDMQKASSCLNNLMTGLGFSSYLGQGGDLGAFVCRILSDRHDACRAAHFNMWLGVPKNTDSLPMDEAEKESVKRGPSWRSQGFSYALEHGTRTSTIGLAMASSPTATLCW